MISLRYLAFLAATVLSMPFSQLAPPQESQLLPRGIAAGNGQHDGYFYSFWTDGGGEVSYQNHARGSYSVTWKNCSNFYGGKGWSPGAIDRNISFSANTFEPAGNSNAYLSVYGTAKNPMVEYYVVENYGGYDPRRQYRDAQQGKEGGEITVDGGVYETGMTRTVLLGGSGSANVLTRVWSVRRAEERRTEGSVSLKKHFDAWKEKLGVQMGSLDYQIVATEGYKSSGVAEVSVSKA